LFRFETVKLTLDLAELLFEIGRIEIVAPDGDHAVLDGDCPHDRQRDSAAAAVIEDINSLAEHDIPCGGNIDDLELGSEIFAEPEIVLNPSASNYSALPT